MSSLENMGKRTWTIGSDSTCDLTVEHSTVSGNHCRLTLDGDRIHLTDLGSTNGTYVNGTPISVETDVSPADRITLGQSQLMPWPKELSSDPSLATTNHQSPANAEQPERTISIGRVSENTIILNHANVSSRHARLTLFGESIILEDLGSTNGTSIGKVKNKIDRAPVRPEDTVFFGSTSYTVADLIEMADQEIRHPQSHPVTKSVEPGSANSPAKTPDRVSMIIGGGVAFLVAIALFVVTGLWKGGDAVTVTSADTSSSAEKEPALIRNDSNAKTPSDSVLKSDPASPQDGPLTTAASPAIETITTDQETSPTFDLSPQDQLARSIFVIVCSDLAGETPFRVGTAFAVDANRIATTAAAIEAMESLKENGFPEAYLYCPATGVQTKIQSLAVHPLYSSLNTRARRAQQQHDQIFDQLESEPPTPDTFDTVKKQLIAAQVEAIEALEQRTSYDVGVLEPATRVEHWLRGVRSARPPRPNQRLTVTGYAFDIQDPFFDPTISMPMEEMQARVKRVTPSSQKVESRLEASGTELQSQNAFLGCPALNADGNVVGIYSRRTPPGSGESEQTVLTFDAALFERIDECSL